MSGRMAQVNHDFQPDLTLYRPAAGIRFDGHELLNIKADQVPSLGIARTFQNIELFEQATVLQNLLVGRHRHRQTSLLSDVLFSSKAYREELRHRKAVEEVSTFSTSSTTVTRGSGVAIWRAKGRGTWSCIGIRTKVAAVGRTRFGIVGGRNRTWHSGSRIFKSRWAFS